MVSAAPHVRIAGETFPVHRFSTDDYLRMIDAGVLASSARVELIDGMIVPMSPAGPRHNEIVMRLTELFGPLVGRARLSVQGTLELAEGHVYDPDFMLLRPREGGYADRLPWPGDVLLLVEVSDRSLQRDRAVKLAAYAEAGIAEYWIIDLESDTLTVHREPAGSSYTEAHTLTARDTARPHAFADLDIALERLFG